MPARAVVHEPRGGEVLAFLTYCFPGITCADQGAEAVLVAVAGVGGRVVLTEEELADAGADAVAADHCCKLLATKLLSGNGDVY